MVERQYVWLIRYGKTAPGLIENIGNYDSDLHQEGVEHAQAMADRILASGKIPQHVFSDPFLRCMHTADVLADKLDLSLKVEEGMTEWQVPSLLVDPNGQRTHPRRVEELKGIFSTIDESYASVNPQGPDRRNNDSDIPVGCPRFPETEEELHERCSTSINKILDNTTGSIVIVSHAPCVQSAAMALGGFQSPAECQFGAWSLGGMTLFSREYGEEKWTLEFYSDTSHMPGEYREGKLGQWSLPSFVRDKKLVNAPVKKSR